METSDWIATLALLASVGAVVYTWYESRKTRAERVESQVREILVGIQRPLLLGVNSARITIDFEEPPSMFEEYDTSGLRELAPRLRRRSDRRATEALADSINSVGAVWGSTIATYRWWQEALDRPGAINNLSPEGMPAAAQFAEFDGFREPFIERAEKLQEDIKAFVSKIDARYR